MNLKLVKEDDNTLRESAVPYDFEVDGDPTLLIKSMVKIMFENGGIGLAGPQVGVQKRVFIMGNEQRLISCFNPEIVHGEGEEKDIEGCLSFPNLWLRVKRYAKINVKFQNMRGEVVEAEFEGLAARVFQHELEHLDGICFDTKVGKLSLEIAKNRRKKKSR